MIEMAYKPESLRLGYELARDNGWLVYWSRWCGDSGDDVLLDAVLHFSSCTVTRQRGCVSDLLTSFST